MIPSFIYSALAQPFRKSWTRKSIVPSRITADIFAMPRPMQEVAAVFGSGESLQHDNNKFSTVFDSFADARITDRSLICHADSIKTLELDNLLRQSVATLHSADNRKENRGARIDPAQSAHVLIASGELIDG